jgi:hypothetical protein
MAKEFPGRRPNCLCCKIVDHEVMDFPRMIVKIERMNMRQGNPEEGKETTIMAEP